MLGRFDDGGLAMQFGAVGWKDWARFFAVATGP